VLAVSAGIGLPGGEEVVRPMGELKGEGKVEGMNTRGQLDQDSAGSGVDTYGWTQSN
jgi:hypothetical protein